MIIRLWNNNSTDSVDYEADTVEEIIEQASERIELPTWNDGWSEVINK